MCLQPSVWLIGMHIADESERHDVVAGCRSRQTEDQASKLSMQVVDAMPRLKVRMLPRANVT